MPRVEYISMEFDNAYIYRHCEVPLEKQGLVLIRGLNMDDGGYLGAGKSSIFEVFAQLQVGKGGKNEVRGGILKDDMVNNYVGSDFRAKLSLRIDGRPYDVVQYRKHSRHSNRFMVIDAETGEDVVPRDQVKFPQRWLKDNLLGIDDVTFFNLIYLAQEFSTIMIHGSESDRRKQLTQMFNLYVYDELYTLTKRELDRRVLSSVDFDALQAELREVTNRLSGLPELKDTEAGLQTAKAELQLLSDRVEAEMAEYTDLTRRQANVKLRNELIAEVRKIFEKAKFIADITKPQDITIQYVEGLKRSYDNLYAEYVTTNNLLEDVKKKATLEAELRKLVGRESDVVQQELTDIKTTIRMLQTVELPRAEEKLELALDLQRLGKPASDLKTLEDEHSQAVLEEEDLKKKVATIHTQIATEVCPTCHRPFTMSVAVLKDLEQQLADLRIDLAAATKKVHDLKRQKDKAAKYYKILEKYKSTPGDRTPEDIQAEIGSLTKKEKALTIELEQANRRTTLQQQLNGLPKESETTLEQKVSNIKLRLDLVESQYTAAKTILDKVQSIVKLPGGNLEELNDRIKEIDSSLKAASDALSKANQKVSELSNAVDEHRRLARRKTVLVDTLSKKDALIKEIACLKSLKRAFDPQGLKQDRFRAILTDATQRTVPAYASVLWQNGTVSLGVADKEGSVQFQMERNTGVAVNSNLLSGGERHKSGLAFLFGMRDLKELYTGYSTNVLIVDEPFGSLDPQGTENLIAILELLKQRFDSIFVISHRPEVLEHPAWDQTWWSVRESNNATLYLGKPPSKYVEAAAELVKM